MFSVKNSMPTLPLTPKGEIFPQALRLKHPAGGGSPLGVRGEKGDLTLNTHENLDELPLVAKILLMLLGIVLGILLLYGILLLFFSMFPSSIATILSLVMIGLLFFGLIKLKQKLFGNWTLFRLITGKKNKG